MKSKQKRVVIMSKQSKLAVFLSQLPEFVFDYIEVAYRGESVNTQIGYSIDIKIFFNFLRETKFPELESNADITIEHIEQLTIRDLNMFTLYLKEYETECISPTGKVYKRVHRNDASGINRKLSGIRGLF